MTGQSAFTSSESHSFTRQAAILSEKIFRGDKNKSLQPFAVVLGSAMLAGASATDSVKDIAIGLIKLVGSVIILPYRLAAAIKPLKHHEDWTVSSVSVHLNNASSHAFNTLILPILLIADTKKTFALLIEKEAEKTNVLSAQILKKPVSTSIETAPKEVSITHKQANPLQLSNGETHDEHTVSTPKQESAFTWSLLKNNFQEQTTAELTLMREFAESLYEGSINLAQTKLITPSQQKIADLKAYLSDTAQSAQEKAAYLQEAAGSLYQTATSISSLKTEQAKSLLNRSVTWMGQGIQAASEKASEKSQRAVALGKASAQSAQEKASYVKEAASRLYQTATSIGSLKTEQAKSLLSHSVTWMGQGIQAASEKSQQAVALGKASAQSAQEKAAYAHEAASSLYQTAAYASTEKTEQAFALGREALQNVQEKTSQGLTLFRETASSVYGVAVTRFFQFRESTINTWSILHIPSSQRDLGKKLWNNLPKSIQDGILAEKANLIASRASEYRRNLEYLMYGSPSDSTMWMLNTSDERAIIPYQENTLLRRLQTEKKSTTSTMNWLGSIFASVGTWAISRQTHEHPTNQPTTYTPSFKAPFSDERVKPQLWSTKLSERRTPSSPPSYMEPLPQRISKQEDPVKERLEFFEGVFPQI